MPRRLKVDGINGTAAIYDVDTVDSTDDGPFDNPLAYLGKVHFHSDLPCPAIIKHNGSFATTGQIVLPATGTEATDNTQHTLFTHNRPGVPLVFGKLRLNGERVALTGSIPFALNVGSAGFGRWAHLGANETNVVLRTTYITQLALPAATIDWEVYLTNVLLEGGDEPTPDNATFRATPDRLTIGRGRFDSRRRYLRIGEDSDSNIPFVNGKTIDMLVGDGSGNNDPGHLIRYSVDGYVQEYTYTSAPGPSTFNASFTRVKF